MTSFLRCEGCVGQRQRACDAIIEKARYGFSGLETETPDTTQYHVLVPGAMAGGAGSEQRIRIATEAMVELVEIDCGNSLARIRQNIRNIQLMEV